MSNDFRPAVSQAVVVSGAVIDPNQATARIALFDEAGDPIDLDAIDASPQTGDDVLLTGFEAGSAGAILATDTVNEALAKVEATVGDIDGSTVVLTGFTTGTAGAVAATDSVNAAIAKLEARIVEIEGT